MLSYIWVGQRYVITKWPHVPSENDDEGSTILIHDVIYILRERVYFVKNSYVAVDTKFENWNIFYDL